MFEPQPSKPDMRSCEDCRRRFDASRSGYEDPSRCGPCWDNINREEAGGLAPEAARASNRAAMAEEAARGAMERHLRGGPLTMAQVATACRRAAQAQSNLDALMGRLQRRA